MPDAESPPLVSPDVAADVEKRANRRALLIVFLVVVIDLLGFGIVLPILPRYAQDYLGVILTGGADNPLTGAFIGLLMSSFSAMQFLFAPIWGRISDRKGRRPILLLGLAGSTVFYALFGIASDLPSETAEQATFALILIFVSRIGTGIAGATIATAQAVIADSTPPERRSRGMALIGAAFGIGFTFGPLLAWASLATGNRGAIGFLAAGLSFVALLLALKLLPETLQPGNVSTARRWLDWSGLPKALAAPALGVLIVTFFLATFAFANFEGTLSLLTQAALKLDEKGNYLIFTYVGLTLAVAQGLFYRRLALKVREVTFIRWGVALMALGMLGLVVLRVGPQALEGISTGQHVYFLAILTLTVTGFAFLTPSIQALISRLSRADQQGEILGVNQSASALARILGPFLGLSLFKLGYANTLPYLVSAVLLILVFLSTLRLRAH